MRAALAAAIVNCGLWAVAPAARAERADRNKPLEVESDSGPGAVMDLNKRTMVINGNVVITQGTMRIRADRVDLQDFGNGQRTAVAIGTPGRPASFHEKRDGVDEFIDATADRIEYDSRNSQLHFVGNAQAKRLVGSTVSDEASAEVIAYDNVADLVTLHGGAPSASGPALAASAPSGRTRLVLMPRAATPGSTASAAGGGGTESGGAPSR